MLKKTFLGLPLALCFILLMGAASPAKAQVQTSFALTNYSACDVKVVIRIICNGVTSEYQGTIATGSAGSGTTANISLRSGPGWDVDDPNCCNINMAVKIIGGDLFTAQGNTCEGLDIQFCCQDGVPAGCSIPDNCTSFVFNPATKSFTSGPGC